MDDESNREFTRIPVRVHAEMKGGGLTLRSTDTRNLSLKGMLLASTESLPEGTDCEVSLLLGDGDAIRIEIEGKVAHCYPDGIAIQFTRIFGVESYDHLRKLILYNAEDPDLVDGEFREALGIHRKD